MCVCVCVCVYCVHVERVYVYIYVRVCVCVCVLTRITVHVSASMYAAIEQITAPVQLFSPEKQQWIVIMVEPGYKEHAGSDFFYSL